MKTFWDKGAGKTRGYFNTPALRRVQGLYYTDPVLREYRVSIVPNFKQKSTKKGQKNTGHT